MKHLRLYPLVFAFLSTAQSTLGLGVEPSPNSDTCVVQAWVRAPDLDPGEIISGQVRVQTKGPCDLISEYSLILRFKERTWAKIVNPDAILPEKPPRYILSNDDTSRPQLQNSIWSRNVRNAVWQEYNEVMKSPASWIIAEEDRVAFETKSKLFEGLTSEVQSIHDFSLLVPTTNYPPAERDRVASVSLIWKSNIPSDRKNEHIYLYTVEVKFANGTIVEVPAGYTAFNTVGTNPESQNNDPEVITFMANFTEISQTGLDPSLERLNASFKVNVTFPHGRHLEQGSTHNLTFRLCDELKTGDLAKYNLMPPSVSLRMASVDRRMQTLFPGKNISVPIPSSTDIRYQLFPTLPDSDHPCPCPNPCRNCHGANARNGKSKWNTTTSVSLDIDKAAFPSFDMYYQSIEAKVVLSFELHHSPKPDLSQAQLDEDIDFQWVPTVRTPEKTRLFGFFQTEFPVTIYPRAKKGIHITHYLSSDARQPVFIDPSVATQLSQLSVGERDSLAPRNEAVINESGRDDVVQNRYFQRPLHYVGDTWHRKVLNSASTGCSRKGKE